MAGPVSRFSLDVGLGLGSGREKSWGIRSAYIFIYKYRTKRFATQKLGVNGFTL